MISVRQALDLILENKRDFGIEKVGLLQATGRVLAREVVADRDFPPFDRVIMDGIAINHLAYSNSAKSFRVEQVQAAGAPQLTLNKTSNCIEVMTGAMLPENTDTVIAYEHCKIEDGIATIEASEVLKMQNVHLQAIDTKAGEILVEKRQLITPATIGILASVGMSEVQVIRLPRIAVCSTGDELVEISHQPAAHQVRRSNSYMLSAALLAESIRADLHHFKDNPEEMAVELSQLLQNNEVIMLSGAVSKGKFDYLPAVLEQLGMNLVFHTVAQRPGKPFLFGTFSNGTLVFGFPGNPVSTFVCYQQFFKPWLQASTHKKISQLTARLTEDVTFKPPMTYHLLVSISYGGGVVFATPVYSSTSGDLVNLSKANGIIKLPAGRDYFNKGEAFELTLTY